MRRTTLLALAAIAAIVAVPSAQAHNGQARGMASGSRQGRSSPAGSTTRAASHSQARRPLDRRGRQGWRWSVHQPGRRDVSPATKADLLRHDRAPSRSSTTARRSASSRACRRSATRARATARLGASDILVNGKHVIGLIGGGGNPTSARRSGVEPAAALFGTDRQDRPVERQGLAVRRLRCSTRPPTTPTTRSEIDSDAYGLASVTAASSSRTRPATTCSASSYKKQISTLAVFPDTLVPRPAVHPAAPAGRDDPDAGRADERRGAAAGSEHLRRSADGLPVPARCGERVGASSPTARTRCSPRASRTSSTSRGARTARSTCSRSPRNGLLSDDPTGRAHRVSGRTARAGLSSPATASSTRPRSRSARTARCT